MREKKKTPISKEEKRSLQEEKKRLAKWDKNIERLKKMGAIAFLVFGLSFNSQAQFSLGMSVGASTEKKAVAGLSVQYDFGPVFINTGYIAHLSRDGMAGTYINAQAGHRFRVADTYFIEPSAGYAYILRSSDYTYLNGMGMIYSLNAGKEINNGSLMVNGTYCEKMFALQLGIRYTF